MTKPIHPAIRVILGIASAICIIGWFFNLESLAAICDNRRLGAAFKVGFVLGYSCPALLGIFGLYGTFGHLLIKQPTTEEEEV